MSILNTSTRTPYRTPVAAEVPTYWIFPDFDDGKSNDIGDKICLTSSDGTYIIIICIVSVYNVVLSYTGIPWGTLFT